MGKFRKPEGARRLRATLIDSRSTDLTLRRWRSAILREEETKPTPNESTANEPTEEPQTPDVEPLPLVLTTATTSGTWSVLPQELVDHIISMLEEDLRSLKACSLACKVMFASSRHLIHRKMYLTSEANWELLTLPERQRYIRGERHELAVRVLSRVAAHGLLPYARHLFINIYKNFTPTNLQPFNHHFQHFDRIQELSIFWLDTPGFLKNFDTYFAKFVPTLRSLHLGTPTGDTRDILDFICRFPHLDDLTLKMTEYAGSGDWRTWQSGTLPIVKSIPPFRGKLKLGGMTEWRGYLLRQLTSLPGKCRFRSIDFRNCESEAEQPIVDACCGTLESVSTTWEKFGKRQRIL